jgi:hypothetical protein
VQNKQGECFYLLNVSQLFSSTTNGSTAAAKLLIKMVKRRAVLVDSDGLDKYNNTIVSAMMLNYSLTVSLLNHGHSSKFSNSDKIIQNDYFSSSGLIDPRQLLHSIRPNQLSSAQYSYNDVAVDSFNNGTYISNSSVPSRNNYFIPLKIFVASDDFAVLQTAVRLGWLADDSGISQQTASNGLIFISFL